jgi:predicted aspartyl protease
MLTRRIAICVLLLPSVLWATDIDGVQPAALDQPRINVLLRRAPNGPPLEVKDAGFVNIQAFLDTGASGVMLSPKTADSLGVRRAKVKSATGNPTSIIFHDVGVAGSEKFHVSEPLHASLMRFHSGAEGDGPEEYKLHTGPFRAQVGPLGGEFGLMDLVMANLDVFGMPVLKGKVMVMDPKPVNKFDDTMRTYVYDPGTRFDSGNAHRDPGIPKTNRRVKLTPVSFARFTHTEPTGAEGPTLVPNPFIGPDPTNPAAARAPGGIVAAHNGKTSTASWLLDTGAAASIISTRQAAAVGVTYKPGTQGTDNPVLVGVPKEKQFALTVGGIGGQKKSAGFFLDSLTIPTLENDPLVFRGAPVLVLDITATDPTTKQQVTIDGVLGMNFLVASAKVSEGLLPDIGNLTEGAFEWVVFDEPASVLGLQLRKDPGR